MTARPILFNGEMVRAILDGRKTQTRRPVPQRPEFGPQWSMTVTADGWLRFTDPAGDVVDASRSPFGIVGDLLYVRETHLLPLKTMLTQASTHETYRSGAAEYVADGAEERFRDPGAHGSAWMKKTPSIHMKKSDSRIVLRVERVWVERLDAITCETATAEGFGPGVVKFLSAWDAIYGERFGRDPWVWCCEFSVEATEHEVAQVLLRSGQ